MAGGPPDTLTSMKSRRPPVLIVNKFFDSPKGWPFLKVLLPAKQLAPDDNGRNVQAYSCDIAPESSWAEKVTASQDGTIHRNTQDRSGSWPYVTRRESFVS